MHWEAYQALASAWWFPWRLAAGGWRLTAGEQEQAGRVGDAGPVGVRDQLSVGERGSLSAIASDNLSRLAGVRGGLRCRVGSGAVARRS
jgi:hypothetical protein